MEDLTEKEHRERINAVKDYMFKNITGDVSLETLSAIASYSPYHFQKVFKNITGESPKQFVIRLKLESALHFVIVHPGKSILEIGLESGFSSAAVFSRAFRNYFNINPEKVRSLCAKEKMMLVKKIRLNPLLLKNDGQATVNSYSVSVTKMQSLKGIYLTAPFNESKKIEEVFRELIRLAKAHDLYSTESRVYGILSPHHGHTYLAFLSIDISRPLPLKLHTMELKANKYAVISTKGNSGETMKAIHYLFQNWLPEKGYRIADQIVGFESFSANPSTIAYDEIVREIHVPIKAQ